MNKHKTLKTSDFNLAIFLFAKDVPLLSIESTSNSKKSTFVFQETQDTKNLIDNFWLRKESIEPSKLLIAERELKRRLYSDVSRNT